MKILLTNLGNRNITYKKKPYSKAKYPNKSFKVWSKDLLSNYSDIKKDLDINIINPLIKSKKINKIYLLYSDQSNYSTRTDQDTVYVSKIIERLLINKYNYEKDEIIRYHIDSKVIDNGKLITEYRKLLRQILNFFPESHVTICDAGGTAQQKMSLKIMAEFILDKDQYTVKYVEKNRLTNDVNIDEYRKVIQEEQALKLIEVGEYEAAASLLNYSDLTKSHNLAKKFKPQIYFSYLFFRFIQNQKLAILNANKLKLEDKTTKFFIQKKPLCENDSFIHFLGEYNVFRLTELFIKALFLKQINKYSLSILTFAQFYETFLEYVIVKMFPKKEYGKPRYRSPEKKRRFTEYFQENFEDFLSTNKDFQIDPDNLATRIIVGKSSSNETVKSICEALSPFIQYTDDCKISRGNTINSIRNKIAHEGKYITNDDLKQDLQYLPELFDKIQYKINILDKDIYLKLNINLCEFIRNPR